MKEESAGGQNPPTKRVPPSAGRQAWGGLRQAGLLTAIPAVLLIGPALGYYLGAAVDHRWPYTPWGMGLGIVFGLLASARVTAQLIRQAQQINEE